MQGQPSVAGFDVVRDPEGAKHHLSYMPQRFGLYEDLTVDENIRFYADLFGVRKAEREERSTQLLQAAGMSEFRKRLAGKLSGGMKQKLGLVCALIHRPKVILLDEPTTGVDPVSRRDFWRILYELVCGRRGHSHLDCLSRRGGALSSRRAYCIRASCSSATRLRISRPSWAKASCPSPRPNHADCATNSSTPTESPVWC